MENVETIRALCVDTDIIVDYIRGREPGKSTFASWRKKAEVLITASPLLNYYWGRTFHQNVRKG